MPNISVLKQSRFLTRADVGKGILVTIKNVYQDNVAPDGQAEELKWCIEFLEQPKAMVLNPTNGQLIAQALGSDEMEEWYGKKIVCYDDPSISFAGKLVGGIRVRAPRNQPSKPIFKAPPAQPVEEEPLLQEFDEGGNPANPF